MTREDIVDAIGDEDLLFMDGYDDCIIGICQSFGQAIKIAYSTNKIIQKLMEGGCTNEEAVEFFEYNMVGGYVGERTPVFIETLD